MDLAVSKNQKPDQESPRAARLRGLCYVQMEAELRKLTKISKTSEFLSVVEDCWVDIQKKHKDVPNVVFTLGSSSGTLGHFAHNTWSIKDKVLPVHEVFLSGEGLARGALDVFETLLHESAHSIAFTRGIRDTSATSQYHNKRFVAVADEVGLNAFRLEDRKHYGFSFTELQEETCDIYSKSISKLERALNFFRIQYDQDMSEAAQVSRSNMAECECGRSLRIARKEVEEGIICAACRTKFKFMEI